MEVEPILRLLSALPVARSPLELIPLHARSHEKSAMVWGFGIGSVGGCLDAFAVFVMSPSFMNAAS